MSEIEKNITDTPESSEVEAKKVVETAKETNEKVEEATEEVKTEKVAEAVAEETVAEVVEEVAEVVADETVAEVVEEVAEVVVEETVAEVVEDVAEENVAKVAEVVDEAASEVIAEETVIEEAEAKKEETNEPEEFDWDSIGKKQDLYTASERKNLEELYSKTLSSITEHEVIEGVVVGISAREIVVNIGYKSDGVLPFNEFRYNPDLKVGDTVDIYVENQEDASGQMVLSHKKARILKSWDRINEAFEKDEIITGYVKSRTKGGLIVDVFGIEAFLPGSQIDVKPIRDYDIYVDKTMEFKVVKINH